MIDDQRTLEIYGYTSDELSKGSHKPIVAVCDECGKYRISENKAYRLICKSCAGRKRVMTEENKEKMRLSKIGNNNPNYGKKDSKETRKRKSRVLMGNTRSKGCTQNLSPEVRLLRTVSMVGNKHNEGKKASDETRHKMSAIHQGIEPDEWKGFTDKNRPHVIPNKQCVQINKPFKGCEGHHLTKSLVIFIPKQLHKHIKHNLKSGWGMASINAIAIQYLHSD